jgi:molybdopterin synthase catalytic subunit
MHIEIRPEPYDPWQEVAQFQDGSSLVPGSYGAAAVFVGTMRDMNLGDNVSAMHLEHYAGMTEELLASHGSTVIAQYSLLELLVLHRVGDIYPNDPIVLVAAWSAHRASAFDGCRDMMEHLKSKATFWKKETLLGSVCEENKTEREALLIQRWVDNSG